MNHRPRSKNTRTGQCLRCAAAAALLGAGMLGGCDADVQAPVGPVAELVSPAAAGAGQVHLATTAGGAPVLSWLEPDGEGRALKYSVLDGRSWGEPRTVARGNDWFVNWADVPSVVPIDAVTWIAHWLVLQPEQPYAYDIVYTVSGDGGRSWSEPQQLNDDDTVAEHGFVTFFRWDADIGVIWLDGRRAGALSIDELLASEQLIGTSLRYARLRHDGTALEHGEIDELACDCCRTDVALTQRGPLLVYRDRTQQERRDVVVRSLAAARSEAPVELGSEGWIIDGCPVNGPAIDARDRDVVVAWFTAAENRPRVRYARSIDAGASFSGLIDVADAGAFGQVDVALLEDGGAVVSWWQRNTAKGMQLVARPVDAGGRLGELRAIAASDEPLPVDVPQMQRVGASLLFAWSQLDDGVHTAVVPIW